LLAAKQYLEARDGNVSVARGCESSKIDGYHLGLDQITGSCGLGLWRWDEKKGRYVGDYSTRRRRDRFPTNARSALDLKFRTRNVAKLKEFNRLLLVKLRAGDPVGADLREFFGPGENGRAYRWARENDWEGELYPVGNSHEWHDHFSWFRDAEDRDKINLFEWHLGPRSVEETPAPDTEEPPVEPGDGPPPDPRDVQIEELTASLAIAQGEISGLKGEVQSLQGMLRMATDGMSRLEATVHERDQRLFEVERWLTNTASSAQALAARLKSEG
jgi:hypothetical protein